MSPPESFPTIPEDAAVAAVDGSVTRTGAATGMVFVHAGRMRLEGAPLAGVDEAFVAEAAAVERAIRTALDLGVSRLRLLVDHHGVACLVQGHRPGLPSEREARLVAALDAAAASGLALSARVVQGHAETADLPSRMNDVAHILGDLGAGETYRAEIAFGPGWDADLVAADRRFRSTYTHQRWNAVLPRLRTAHFLGLDPATVDALVRAGHLDVVPEGVTRRSAARVYEVAQRLRLPAFFGFDEAERVPGRHVDEISRGWDGRPSGFTGRKSGLRPPVPEPLPQPLPPVVAPAY